MSDKPCGTCKLYDPQQKACRLTGAPVDANKDFCSKHTTQLITCETCGALMISSILVPHGDQWHQLCGNCAAKLGSCAFCKRATACSFESDPSPLPKMIQKQIRQGNMVSVITVKNPARIDITCKKDCPCFDENFECMRQFNYCERMEHIYD